MFVTNKMIEDLKKEITERKAKRIFLQAPEGLKMRISDICKKLEASAEVIVSVEPCYGACDLKDHEAKMLGCDVLVHIGHADFGVEPEIPVIYHELRMDYDFTKILEKDMKKLEKFGKIGIMTTVQFVDEIPKIKEYLEKHGKRVFVGKNKKTGYSGHVLGCDFSAVKQLEDRTDCFIYFGSGEFHPSGFLTGKKVFSADMESGKITDVSEKIRKLFIKKELSLEKARNMKNFAVYVSTKSGQSNVNIAINIKKELERKGKNVIIISADELTPEKITGVDIGVIVNTACPRLHEDTEMFRKVIINGADISRL